MFPITTIHFLVLSPIYDQRNAENFICSFRLKNFFKNFKLKKLNRLKYAGRELAVVSHECELCFDFDVNKYDLKN